MIGSFTFTGTPKIVFGWGRLEEVPQILTSFGRRVLIVTGSKSFISSDWWERLSEEITGAGLSWEIIHVGGEPSPDLVDDAVRTYKDADMDAVLGIGGGSAIDASKAIAALLPFGNSVMDHLEGVGRGVPYVGPSTPCIAVPTTAGTGAEATKNAVLSAQGTEGFKRSFRHDCVMPDVAVVDPSLTATCPPDITAAAGMDALTQLIESYVSSKANPMTDALAWSGLKAAKYGLFAAYESPNDKTGRSAMSYAALMSGITLAQAGLGVVHGLASPLGAFFPIPHGNACAALIAPATKMNIKVLRERDPESPALEKYARLGELLNPSKAETPNEALDMLADTLHGWTRRLGISGLGAYGIDDSDLDKIASACTRTDPALLTKQEVLGILRDSL